ncbi:MULTISPECIES: hypothetical protein [unclassified Marinobacter]|uniref:hypothetical protein n=1 Tax=unclassified Marinobacter TaxID=83889 RepID=UPI001268818B|nr:MULTISPECIES: hypothetical protein [unclassified Marinobacter]QFS86638.1 hypothetical protein FIV08_07300 [Marinobacter sp. THAF197a]QFT50422.1 hypothetical protein FIU96_07230 [Marinobacter sp. THAF39]QFT52944.1 hypothetical protein FIU96_20035 [Marinobacter sp. THAF39]
MTEHLVFLSIMALGHMAHTLKAVVQIREADKTMTLRKYIAERPYKTGLSVAGSLIGYVMLADTGQLTLVAAMGVGYMADSVFDVAANKTRTQI